MLTETKWEARFKEYFSEEVDQSDGSHDLGHFERVARISQRIAAVESFATDSLILLAAAYFHDLVSLPKNHPEKNLSSHYAAIEAQKILTNMDFPAEKIPFVYHAIEAHSYSAQLAPQTLEAKIIQDADRMEALGALGILRTFYVSGRLGRSPYDAVDLFAEKRALDDRSFGLDHFYCKLFKLPNLLQTEGGRQIAAQRMDILHSFVAQLSEDVSLGHGGAFNIVWTCYKAGERGLKLFDLSDPFAERRPLQDDRFLVDHLIPFEGFAAQFLAQLSVEIRQAGKKN